MHYEASQKAKNELPDKVITRSIRIDIDILFLTAQASICT